MSNTYIISDLHLGHRNILKFSAERREWANTVLEHDHTLITRIRSVCKNKRDTLYILGDVAFEVSSLELLNEIPARKILVRGNHDVFQDGVYRKYFDSIQGLIKKRYNGQSYWFSHAPVHPHELRGAISVHGHTHSKSLTKSRYTQELDPEYFNVCVEVNGGYPINAADLPILRG